MRLSVATLTTLFVFSCAWLAACDRAEAPAAVASEPEGIASNDSLAEGAALRGAQAPSTLGAEARVVSLGGAVTETLWALGLGDRIVGIDATSVYPPEVRDLPEVGYFRALNAEGVAALNPTDVVALEGAGPQSALEAIERAGARLHALPAGDTLADARRRITAIGQLAGRPERAAELVASIDADLERAAERAAAAERPRALFVYARGPNTLLVSGQNTPAAEMLATAGADNAGEGFEGFKPLTPEAVIAAAPEVIVVPERGAQSIGGAEGVLALPGVERTPAGRAERVVTVDDAELLGMGPRAGQGVLALQDALGIGAP